MRKPIRPNDDNPIEVLRWCCGYAQWAWNTITSAATDQVQRNSSSPEVNPEASILQNLYRFWSSTPVWGAIAVLIGVIAAQLSLTLLFIGVWAVVLLEFIHVGFFRSRTSKIVGNSVAGPLLVLVFLCLWKVVPKPRQSPTLEEQAQTFVTAFMRKLPTIGQTNTAATGQSDIPTKAAISSGTPRNSGRGNTALRCMDDATFAHCTNIEVSEKCRPLVTQLRQIEINRLNNLLEKYRKMNIPESGGTEGQQHLRDFLLQSSFGRAAAEYRDCCRTSVLKCRTEIFHRLGLGHDDSSNDQFYVDSPNDGMNKLNRSMIARDLEHLCEQLTMLR